MVNEQVKTEMTIVRVFFFVFTPTLPKSTNRKKKYDQILKYLHSYLP